MSSFPSLAGTRMCFIMVGTLWLGLSITTCSGARVRTNTPKEVDLDYAAVEKESFGLDSIEDASVEDENEHDEDEMNPTETDELDSIEEVSVEDENEQDEDEMNPTETDDSSEAIQENNILVPVFEYWNFNLRKHTVHADPPDANEVKHRILFYAFPDRALGTEAVGTFLHVHRQNMKINIHLGEAQNNEWQQGIACHAYPREVVGSVPVFQFWNSQLQENTYHIGGAEAHEKKTRKKAIFYAYENVSGDMNLQEHTTTEEHVLVLTPVFEFTDHILNKKSYHSGAPFHGEEYTGMGAQFYAWTGPTPGTEAVYLYFDTSNRQYNIHVGTARKGEVLARTAFYVYTEQINRTQPVFKFKSKNDKHSFDYRLMQSWGDDDQIGEKTGLYAYASVPPGMAVDIPDEYPGDDPCFKPIYNFTNKLLEGRIKRGRGRPEKLKATTHAGVPWAGEHRNTLTFWGLSRKAPGTVPFYSFHHNAGLSGRRRTYTLHSGNPWPRETRNNIEFYAYTSQVPGTEPVNVYWHTTRKQPVYHMGAPEEYEVFENVPNLAEQNNGSNIMFYAFRQPRQEFQFTRTNIEKTGRQLLETRQQLIPWLNALIDYADKQQTGYIVTKGITTTMAGVGFGLLFTPAFPVGIGLSIASAGLSVATMSTNWFLNKWNARLMKKYLAAEMYLSDKFRVDMDITKARSIMIKDAFDVDDNESMFIAHFTNQTGVVGKIMLAVKYAMTAKKIATVLKAPDKFAYVDAVELASATWAEVMTVSTVFYGVSFAFQVLDLLISFLKGNKRKKEAVEIRDRVDSSLSSLTSFVGTFDKMRMLADKVENLSE